MIIITKEDHCNLQELGFLLKQGCTSIALCYVYLTKYLTYYIVSLLYSKLIPQSQSTAHHRPFQSHALPRALTTAFESAAHETSAP